MDDSRAAVVTAVFERGWNQQDFDGLATALAAVDLHIGGTRRSLGLDDLRAIVRGWHVGFPDFRFELHSVVADGDHAACHATLHGTNSGPWQGAAPTGRTVAVEHMFFFRFDGDAITDVWELLDRQRLADDLAAEPADEPAGVPDGSEGQVR